MKQRSNSIDIILGDITPAVIRQSWDFDHITEPNPPCPLVGVYLSELLPGATVYIGDTLVRRGEGSKSKYYTIGGRRYRYADALALLAGERDKRMEAVA